MHKSQDGNATMKLSTWPTRTQLQIVSTLYVEVRIIKNSNSYESIDDVDKARSAS